MINHSVRTRLVVLTGSAALLVTGAVPLAAGASATAAHRTHYQLARTAWERGAHASAAVEGRYWLRAAHDLDAAKGDRYHAQRHDLRVLVSTPNTGLTPTQQRRVQHVTRQLNGFFHTPGLYL